MIYLLSGIFIGVFILSALLCWVFRGVALRFGYVDKPDMPRKQHEKPVPYGGGLGLVFTFILTGLVFLLAVKFFPEKWFPEAARIHLEGFRSKLGDFYMLIIAGIVYAAVGFLDDIKPVKEYIKLIVEIGIAAGLWFAGFRITVFIPSEILSFIITVLWVTGIANSFNFLDNMDGLSAGVAFISSVLFAVFGLQTGQLFIAGYFTLIAGASLGFLLFNFPPAVMFMGDCGSLFLGSLIALGAVVSTFYQPEAQNRIFPLLIPLLILSLPLFDTFSVIVIRLLKGENILKGDRNHFSHRLLRLGMNTRTALMTIYLVSAGVGFSALYMIRLTTKECFIALFQAVCVFAIIILLEYNGRKKESEHG